MEAVMADHWRHAEGETDLMRGIGDDDATYAAGWTIFGVATLATIVAVWVFAIWQSMIRKSMPSGHDPMGERRFSGKIMLKQKDRAG